MEANESRDWIPRQPKDQFRPLFSKIERLSRFLLYTMEDLCNPCLLKHGNDVVVTADRDSSSDDQEVAFFQSFHNFRKN